MIGRIKVIETDPVFLDWDKSGGITITENQISDLKAYLLSEADPVFAGWDKSAGISITENQISDLQDYLTSESDPVFSVSPSAGIAAQDITNWNATHGWGNHASAGYLTEETEPDFNGWNKSTGISITQSQISDLSIAEGHIPFADAAGKLIDDAKLFYNKNSDRLGLGLSAPARMFHMQDNNATIRIDRDTNSPAVQLHRFPSGDFSTPWKGFMFRVDATGPDEGTFAIVDYHQAVTGGGDARLTIDTDGKVIIPGVLDIGGNLTAEKIYLKDSGADYLGWTAGDSVFEFSGGLMIGGTLFCNDLNGDNITIATADITDLLETPIIRNADGDTVTIQDNLYVDGDIDITGGLVLTGYISPLTFANTTEDKISLFEDRLGIAGMYGFGVESNALYHKSPAAHRWYIAANADNGVSVKMNLNATGLGLGTNDPKEELHIKSLHPTILLEESDGASNEKVWEFGVNGDELALTTANDLYSGTSTVFKAHGRGGTTVTKFSFPNSNVSIGTDIVGDSPLKVIGLDEYSSNEDAILGGLTVGEFFRNGAGTDKVCVVH